MKHTIVCLSSQSWDDGMWTNKQHIMSRLAKDHHIIYVDYGLRPLPLYLFKRIKSVPKSALNPFKLLTNGAEKREPGLFIFDWYTPLFAGLFPYGNFLRDRSLFDIKCAMVARYLKKEGIEDPIVWVYHPGYGDAVDRIPHKLLVYDCVDNYPSFPAYRDNPDWLADREDRLCRKADLVTCTAPALYDLKHPFNPDNTFLVHNVGDADHFKKADDPSTPVADDLKAIEGPVVGFVGAVSDYKLNSEWLLELAIARPDLNVVVVGPIGKADPNTDVGRLAAQPNVHLLGHRDYADLPTYLKRFDVAVIPYRINEHTESVFPIKFFEFLATGTPVVVSNLPSLVDFYDDVLVAETAEDFIEKVDDALADNSSETKAHRQALANENSWPKRIAKILALIEERLQRKS